MTRKPTKTESEAVKFFNAPEEERRPVYERAARCAEKEQRDMTNNTVEKIVEEYWSKVNEIRQCTDWDGDKEDGPIFEFGGRLLRGNELFIVPDWGNIEKYLRTTLTKALQEERERTKQEIVEFAKEEKAFCVECIERGDEGLRWQARWGVWNELINHLTNQ